VIKVYDILNTIGIAEISEDLITLVYAVAIEEYVPDLSPLQVELLVSYLRKDLLRIDSPEFQTRLLSLCETEPSLWALVGKRLAISEKVRQTLRHNLVLAHRANCERIEAVVQALKTASKTPETLIKQPPGLLSACRELAKQVKIMQASFEASRAQPDTYKALKACQTYVIASSQSALCVLAITQFLTKNPL
jgi:hypothetical protein